MSTRGRALHGTLAALSLVASLAHAGAPIGPQAAPSARGGAPAAPVTARASVDGVPGLIRSVSALPVGDRLTVVGHGYGLVARDLLFKGRPTSQLGGGLSVSYAPLEVLDVFGTLAGADAWSAGAVPDAIASGTDLVLGLRGRLGAGPVHLGLLAALLWSARMGGGAGAGTGLGARVLALSSLDGQAVASLPLLLHLAGGYRSDAGATLAHAHFGAWPTFAERLWRWDVVEATAALEGRFGFVAPFLEAHAEIPIGAGAPRALVQSRVTPGVAVSLPANLRLLAGVDLGMSPALRDGIPATPAWAAHLALAWSGLGPTRWSLAPSSARAPLAAAALVALPAKVAADAILTGKVTDLEGKPLRAMLSFPGDPVLEGQVWEAEPDFEIHLRPGARRVEVRAEGYLVRGRTLKLVGGTTVNYHFVLRPIPSIRTAALGDDRIDISQMIQFAFNESTILPNSFFILDEVVDVLMRNPKVRALRIEGHTDSIGSAEANLKLSAARANSVRDYLLEHGVAAGRMTTAGFGETRPVAENRHEEGRARNRRVQFLVVQ